MPINLMVVNLAIKMISTNKNKRLRLHGDNAHYFDHLVLITEIRTNVKIPCYMV